MEDKLKSIEKNSYCFLGCLVLLISNNTLNFASGGNIIFPALTAVSGWLLLSDFYINKWEKIFSNCGLFNSDKKFPILKRTEKSEQGKIYIFSIPTGLCFSDFQKKQEQLETALKDNIILDITKNYNLKIQVYHATIK